MRIRIGNIFESKAQTLVNTVNCVGVMGKGIALEFKKKYPNMFDEYVRICERHELKPGEPYYYSDLLGNSVINFPTKDHWRSPSRLSYIEKGLDWFRGKYSELGISSIAFPPLGCGNGGLKWEMVGPLMYAKLSDLPIDIEIYAPYGTNPDHITERYLSSVSVSRNEEIVGNKVTNLNKYWLFILYTIQQLNNSRYSLNVGRTIYQKVCYILTRSKIPTGFHFIRGAYGPYSAEAKNSITVLSNANLMLEKQMGRMIVTVVDSSFTFPMKEFTEDEIKSANRAVDLLSRIKSTDHAEMIATVLFSYDELKTGKKVVTDLDIYEDVLDWKKKYRNAREMDVCRTIENLATLGWIYPQYTGRLKLVDEEFI